MNYSPTIVTIGNISFSCRLLIKEKEEKQCGLTSANSVSVTDGASGSIHYPLSVHITNRAS